MSADKKEGPVFTKAQSELIAFLFDSHSGASRARMSQWITNSPRYTAFAAKYKDKIRKKLRVTREKDAIADLLHELQIPYWLLQDKRFDLAYEPYLAEKTRGPDYAATFRTNFTFNIEITHARDLQSNSSLSDETAIDYRLVDVLCGKLKQLIGNMANLLFVVTAPSVPNNLDLDSHIAWIKDKAESQNPLFYARHRFVNPSEFFKYFERLSGLMLVSSAEEGEPILWTNPRARIRIPDPVKNALSRTLADTQTPDP